MNTDTTKRVAGDLQLKFWRAYDRMRAAEVPATDRVESGAMEPVTISGYYEVRTKSGNPAWAYFHWRNGAVTETHCTYDPAAHRKCDELIGLGADPFWIEVRS